MNKRRVVALLSMAAVTIAGCSSGPDRPDTYAVTGKVTHNDKPVEGATVTFVPGSGPYAAVGITDAAGTYTLMTFAQDDGAVPGDYRVKIVKVDDPGAMPPSTAAPPPSEGDGDDERMPMIAPNWRPPEPKSLIPEQYAKPESSGLTATVTETAEQNVFDFVLND